MFCTKCGKEIDQHHKYCVYCGAENKYKIMIESKANKKQNFIAGVALIGVIIVSLIVAICIPIISSKNDEDIDNDNNHFNVVTSENNNSKKTEQNDNVSEESIDDSTDDVSSEYNTEQNVPSVSNNHIKGILASSELDEPMYGICHDANSVLDGDDKTAWSESSNDDGVGESISISLDEKCVISGFEIKNGYQKSEELFYKNNRVASIKVVFSDGTYEVFDLLDEIGWQEGTFSTTHESDSVDFVIMDIYEGNEYDDTLITEISLE